MEENRHSEWIKNSIGLMYIEMLLVGNAQGLGILDVELIEEFPKLKINSQLDGDRLRKLRHVTISELWVMGTYELIRLINEINKKRNFLNENSKEKLKKNLTIFTEVRTPLTKFQKQGKEKRLYSKIATKNLFYSDKGVGWNFYDGKKKEVFYRKDLGDLFLELLKEIKNDVFKSAQ
ncbi:MAG: hypothetical protein KJ905_00700 [Nanoarchaeota archaeon]|nr:hypothetical protein [Nanoarchaeota archaeon]MBU1501279.1 hypothetical protein [Nanoarchaeota archaeon]